MKKVKVEGDDDGDGDDDNDPNSEYNFINELKNLSAIKD